MAKMIPDFGSDNEIDLHLKDSPTSEVQVYKQLKKELPDSIYIIHSPKWVSRNMNGRVDGEADFIIIDPNKGILILEVKGGRIEFNAISGQWYSVNKYDERKKVKDPFSQASLNKFALLEKWNELTSPRKVRVPISHAVCFPDVDTISGKLPTNAATDIILNKSKLYSDYIYDEVKKVFDFHEKSNSNSDFTKNIFEQVLSLFKSDCNFKTSIKADIKFGNILIEKVTTEQYEILDQMDLNSNMCIIGGAGTGKTVLAMEKARRMAQEGKKSLIACYNIELAKYIHLQVKDEENIDVFAFDVLAEKLCNKVKSKDGAELSMEFAKGKSNPKIKEDFYNNQSPYLMSCAIDLLDQDDKYDAIIVDEGQDLTDLHHESLHSLLKDEKNGLFYIFLDENQKLHSNKTMMDISSYPKFKLTKNLRNTEKIHEFSLFFKPRIKEKGSGFIGEDVNTIIASKDNDTEELRKVLNKLIVNDMVNPGDIAVFSGNSVQNKEAFKWDKLKGIPYTHTVKDASDKVLINSIHKLKGIERPIVIVNNIDYCSLNLHSNLLYVAATRAKFHLYVIAKEETYEKFNIIQKDIKKAA